MGNATGVEVLSVTEDGVTMFDNEFSLSEGVAIACKNKSKTVAKKNTFKNNVTCGVDVSGYSHVQLCDNKFVENGFAAHVDAWSGIMFLRNDLKIIRLTIGIEDAHDIINDLKQALDAL